MQLNRYKKNNFGQQPRVLVKKFSAHLARPEVVDLYSVVQEQE